MSFSCIYYQGRIQTKSQTDYRCDHPKKNAPKILMTLSILSYYSNYLLLSLWGPRMSKTSTFLFETNYGGVTIIKKQTAQKPLPLTFDWNASIWFSVTSNVLKYFNIFILICFSFWTCCIRKYPKNTLKMT